MKKLRDVLAHSKVAGLFIWVLVAGLLTAFYIDQRMRDRELPVHPYIEATPGIQQGLAEAPVFSENRLFILFIDMMRFESAMDSHLMPTLNRLKADSTWGRVTPCKSNMTVHCVEATLSGFDRSSLLSFAEDYYPNTSADAGVWPFLLAERGYRIKVVANYVIQRLCGEALADIHFYKRGDAAIDAHSLAGVAFDYFRQDDTDVALLYLIDAHDAGHQHGAAGPEYKAALQTADEVLGRLLEERRPDDTILVYGDHGCNKNGQHNYSQEAPTFYLYNGPEIAGNHRQDIHIFSHKFFLNVLFRLPFTDSYQGETYFHTFPEGVRNMYGPPEALELKRSAEVVEFRLTWTDYVLLGVVVMGSLLAGLVLLKGVRRRVWLVVALAGFLFVKAWGYEAWDGLVHDSRLVTWLVLYGVYFLVGYFLGKRFLGSDGSRGGNVMSGATALALALPLLHYPTLYGFGALRGVPVAILLMLVGSVGAYMERSQHAAAGWRRLVLLLAAPPAVAFAASQYAIFVENFRIVHFYVFRPENSAWYVAAAALAATAAALALAVVDSRTHSLPDAPARRWGAVTGVLVLELVMFFTYEFNLAVLFQLNGIVVVAGLYSRLLGARIGNSRLSGAIMIVLLALMCMMVSFGFRTIGIDFKFASLWFGHRYIKLWYLVFLVTFLKYCAPVILVLLAMGRDVTKQCGPTGIKLLAGMNLLLVPYTAFLFFARPTFTLLVDTVEELVYSLATLLALTAAAWLVRKARPN